MIAPPDFWYAQKTPGNKLARLALMPASWVYSWLTRKKFDLYFPLPMARPVICVGNLVAGGAGKTPVVISLSHLLQENGYNPHLLIRGYGGTEQGPLQVSPGRDTAADVGDEALLLVEHAPTWVAANRALGAQIAMDSGANIVVMDDGFQNPVIYKDFSLLVVDGGAGLGNRCVMPAGPLREDAAFGLSRADAVVIVGDDKDGIADYIRRLNSVPVFYARTRPADGNIDIAGRKVAAFAGIGRPRKFYDTLVDAGAHVMMWMEFPDHFPYDEEDLTPFIAEAENAGALILTTAKDYVRLPPVFRDKVAPFAITMEWEDPAALMALIEQALQKRST